MNKLKPHGLMLNCSYEIIDKIPKVTLKTTKLEGWVTMGEGKTKITIPMRSWVSNFLQRFQYIFSGTTNGSTRIAKVDWTSSASSASDVNIQAGILLGTGDTAFNIGNTNLEILKNYSNETRYGNTSLTKTYAVSDGLKTTAWETKVSRLISNITATPFSFYEFGIKTRPVTPATAAPILISRDVEREGWRIDSYDSVRVEIALKIPYNHSNGGIMPNFLRMFYNLFLAGDDDADAYTVRSGLAGTSYAYTQATTDGPYVLNGGSQKYWGILVGYYDKGSYGGENPTFPEGTTSETTPDITDETQATDSMLHEYTSELEYGANFISPVQILGNKTAYFYVTRDITNTGNTTRKINRIGLLTKGAVTNPSILQNDQMYLALNKPSNNTNIILGPGQTIRITYTFQI